MALKYWVGGTGPWTGAGPSASRVNWSNSSGGATGAIAPASTDDVILDGNSGAGTITISGTVQMRSIEATSYLGTLTGSGNMQIVGSNTGNQNSGKSIELGTGMVYSYSGVFTITATNGSGSINFNGKTHSTGSISFNSGAALGPTAVWTLANNLTATGSTITVTTGGFTTNNYNITCGRFDISAGVNTKVLDLGSSTITLTNTSGAVWANQSTGGLTFNAGTSTIRYNANAVGTISFLGGGVTYYNVEFLRGSSTSQLTVTGNNTFFNFIDDTSTAAHTISFATSVSFTNTFQNFNVSGSSTSSRITLSGGTAGANFVKSTTGAVLTYYLNIGSNTTSVTPDNTWYAYGSIGTGTGWVRNNRLSLLGIG